MARPIATIPELEGAEAEEFVRKANENLKRRGTDVLSVTRSEFRAFMERSKKLQKECLSELKRKEDVVS